MATLAEGILESARVREWPAARASLRRLNRAWQLVRSDPPPWRVADRLQAWLDQGCDVHAYFNNDWHGHAVVDARYLADRLGEG